MCFCVCCYGMIDSDLSRLDRLRFTQMASPGGADPSNTGSGPDWLGLLKWSLQYHDGTQDTQAAPLVPERREWLEKVVQETFVDIPQQMKETITELEKIVDDDTKTATALELLEKLQDETESLDFALVFCQLGGLPVLSRYLASSNEDLCVSAISVLATLTQNNARVQVEVLKRQDPIPRLCNLVVAQSSSERLVAKALHGVSCTVRGIPPVEDAFAQQYGLEVFGSALARDGARVRQKALFFLQALLSSDHAGPQLGQHFTPLVPAIVQSLEDDDRDVRHTAQTVLSELSDLLGSDALKAGPGGSSLMSARDRRLSHIGTLGGDDRDDAQDEVTFWETLDAGGRFRRPEAPAQSSAQVAGDPTASQGQAAQQQQQHGEDVEDEPAPLLLLEPPRLSAAHAAP